MLGTPNYGSFAIPQAMTGEDTMVKLLAAADLTNSLSEILPVINSFVGSYQMLPSPSKLPPAQQMLYRLDHWGSAPVSERHLSRALQFHTDMERPDTADPGACCISPGATRRPPAASRSMRPATSITRSPVTATAAFPIPWASSRTCRPITSMNRTETFPGTSKCFPR